MGNVSSGGEKEQRSEGARGRNILLCYILPMVVFRSLPGCRTPGAGPRPAAPPPIDPRSVLGSVAALTWRQPTGVLRSALLLPCHVATTAPDSRILSIPLYIPLKWCLCKVMIMSYWIINYMTMIIEDLPPSLCPPFTFPLGGENRK